MRFPLAIALLLFVLLACGDGGGGRERALPPSGGGNTPSGGPTNGGPTDSPTPPEDNPPTTPPEPTRVLFVGNSLTSVHDVPGLFGKIAAQAGLSVIIEQVTPGGRDLQAHAGHPSGEYRGRTNEGRYCRINAGGATGAVAKIRSSRWNFVIIQGQSSEGKYDPSDVFYRRFLCGAHRLGEEARAVGALPVLYMTWSWPLNYSSGSAHFCVNHSCDTYFYVLGYKNATKVAEGKMAPVGMAFHRLLEGMGGGDIHQQFLWPCCVKIFGIDLISDYHQTREGAYVAALTIFATVFERSPVGAAWQGMVLSHRDANWAHEVQEGVAKAVADFKLGEDYRCTPSTNYTACPLPP